MPKAEASSSLQPLTNTSSRQPSVPTDPSSLYRSHFAFVWRNLYRLGVSRDALEDAAQDVFLAVHRRFGSYDARRSSLETWLFAIIIRVASNYRRTFRRRLKRLVPWRDRDFEWLTSAESASPAVELEKRQRKTLLDRILAGLDERKRVILVLVDVEELTVPDAAEVLGINLNTAYFRLRKARQRFQQLAKRRLAKEHHPGGGGRV